MELKNEFSNTYFMPVIKSSSTWQNITLGKDLKHLRGGLKLGLEYWCSRYYIYIADDFVLDPFHHG